MIRLRYSVVLASASPRRAELLKTLIPEFTVAAATIDEEAQTQPDPWQTAQNLARSKAFEVFENHPEALVIGGDTVVALAVGDGWKQFAKPADAAEATAFLKELSGKEHQVITGVALRWPKGMQMFTETTHVTFRDLTSAEIEAYVASGEPMDKAGGYAIQGAARAFVSELCGSESNVIGLPLEHLEEALRDVK
ncbi:MAG: Maf family protein [Armatimonadetes bacterium]|nr:Maf family protein [Armatimonadota bacterium]